MLIVKQHFIIIIIIIIIIISLSEWMDIPAFFAILKVKGGNSDI